MNAGERERALLRRQQALVARSAGLRTQFAADLAPWRAPLAWVDWLRAQGRWLRAHPEWPAAALVVVLVLRPRHTLRWTVRLWSTWRLVRKLGHALQGPPPDPRVPMP